ncbi:hypothetical protein EDI_167530 [Entamoeba dispar SAW760]|uniref:Uncharacterized protein n=1 Tax=Entamoeba dispar (strain ATCC PRA-260 / SAW760) TaxID=370354 RepID=B0EP29_ENTDS|nr:uncharacterized protein EDI_167530 [Entamoeba dispar SAW760]EDR23704.1 hypothetical protein EDI_167530 [Entamoeba dispar SAW760]|eukprot:EDR23704.1 hypothetical protein EDI_167530 [Entamoeba dispar SAW760]
MFIVLLALFTFSSFSKECSCNTFMSLSSECTSVTVDSNCYLIVDSPSTVSLSTSGESSGKVVVQRGASLTVPSMKGVQISNRGNLLLQGATSGKIFSSGEITISGGVTLDYISVSSDASGSISFGESTESHDVIFKQAILSKGFSVSAPYKLSIEKLGSDSSEIVKVTSARFDITVSSYESDISYYLYHNSLSFTTGNGLTKDKTSTIKCYQNTFSIISGDFSSGAACPCSSSNELCDLFIGAEGTIESEESHYNTLTVDGDKEIVLKGKEESTLTISTLALSADISFEKFKKVVIYSQTGEHKITIKDTVKEFSILKASSREIDTSASTFTVQSSISSSVRLTVQKGNANILSDNNFIINANGGSVTFKGSKFSGEDVVILNSGYLDITGVKISKDFTSTIKLSSNSYIKIKPNSTTIDDHFIVTSLDEENKELVPYLSCDLSYIRLGTGSETCLCMYNDPTNNYLSCDSFYSVGSGDLVMDDKNMFNDFSKQKFTFGHDSLIIGGNEFTSGLFSELDMKDKSNVIIKSSLDGMFDLTISKFTNVPKYLTFENINLTLPANFVFSDDQVLILKNSKVSFNQQQKFKRIEMDHLSSIKNTGGNVIAETAHFDLSGLNTDVSEPLIELANDPLVVNKVITYTKGTESDSHYLVITKSNDFKSYNGDIPNGLSLKCTNRAFMYVGSASNNFKCSEIGLAQKVCKLKNTDINDNTIDLSSPNSYEGNIDQGCPCRHDISESSDSCDVVFDSEDSDILFTSSKNEQTFSSMNIKAKSVNFEFNKFIVNALYLSSNVDFNTPGGVKITTLETMKDVKIIFHHQSTLGYTKIHPSTTLDIKCETDTFFEGNINVLEKSDEGLNEDESAISEGSGVFNLEVDSELTIRNTSKVIVNSLMIYKNNETQSHITINEGSKLKFVNGAKLQYDMSVFSHKTIFDFENLNQFEASDISYTQTGDQLTCSALASVNSYNNEQPTSLDQKYFDVGCNPLKIILCPASFVNNYACEGRIDCVFKDTDDDIILANESSSYLLSPNCPCGQEDQQSSKYTSACSVSIPNTLNGKNITNFYGHYVDVRVDSSVSINVTSASVDIQNLILRGTIYISKDTNDANEGTGKITASCIDIYTKQPTKVYFEIPSEIKSTKTRESSVFFSFRDETSFRLGNTDNSTIGIEQGSSITLNLNGIPSDKNIELSLGTDMKDADLALMAKKPLRFTSDIIVNRLTLSRSQYPGEQDSSNKLFFLDIGDDHVFKVNSLSVVPLEVVKYPIVQASDIEYIYVGDFQKSSYLMDEFKSVLYYKGDTSQRESEIVCVLNYKNPVDGYIIYNDSEIVDNDLLSWNRRGCPCDGGQCILKINDEEKPSVDEDTVAVLGLNATALSTWEIDIDKNVELNEGKAVVDKMVVSNVKTLTFKGLSGSISLLNYAPKTLESGKSTNPTYYDIGVAGIYSSFKIESIQTSNTIPVQPSGSEISYSARSDLTFMNNSATFSLTFDDEGVYFSSVVATDSRQVRLGSSESSSISSLIHSMKSIRSSIYFEKGQWDYEANSLDIEVDSPQTFPIVFAPSSNVRFRDVEVTVHIPSISLNEPLYLFRVTSSDYIANNNITVVVTKDPVNTDNTKTNRKQDSSVEYEFVQVCSIYLAVVPKGYVIESCPDDPCGTSDAVIIQNITNDDVPTWVIVILVIVGVIIVIIIILFIVFIVVARMFLLRRKNNKVFDDDDNIFYQTAEETTEKDESSNEENQSGESGSGSGSSSGSSSGTGSYKSGSGSGSQSGSNSGSEQLEESKKEDDSSSGSAPESSEEEDE